MKTLPLLTAAFILLAGSAQALEITYSGQGITGPPRNGNRAGVDLPLFDAASPDVPDNATLQAVLINFTAAGSGYAVIFNPYFGIGAPPSTHVYSGTATLFTNIEIGEPAYHQSFSTASPFVTNPAPAGGSAAFGFQGGGTGSQSIPGNKLGNYIAGNPTFSSVWVSAEFFAGVSYSFSGTPGPQSPFAFVDTHGTLAASVTYTYGVPDGGSTLPLLMAGLFSCRLIASRRWTGSRS